MAIDCYCNCVKVGARRYSSGAKKLCLDLNSRAGNNYCESASCKLLYVWSFCDGPYNVEILEVFDFSPENGAYRIGYANGRDRILNLQFQCLPIDIHIERRFSSNSTKLLWDVKPI